MAIAISRSKRVMTSAVTRRQREITVSINRCRQLMSDAVRRSNKRSTISQKAHTAIEKVTSDLRETCIASINGKCDQAQTQPKSAYQQQKDDCEAMNKEVQRISKVTIAYHRSQDRPQGDSKKVIEADQELIDDVVLDAANAAELKAVITDDFTELDSSVHTGKVSNDYFKLETNVLGAVNVGDVLSMTGGVYTDVPTAQRQAMPTYKYEAEMATRIGTHMQYELNDLWTKLRHAAANTHNGDIIDALRWNQISTWLSSHKYASLDHGTRNVTVERNDLGCITVTYATSVAANLAEAVVMTYPGLTYKTVKSVIAGLDAVVIKNETLKTAEISLPASAVRFLNIITDLIKNHRHGEHVIRWLRTYLLNTLKLSIRQTAICTTTSYMQAAEILRTTVTNGLEAVVSITSYPFDPTKSTLLIKTLSGSKPLLRKAKYGSYTVFDHDAALDALPIEFPQVKTNIGERVMCAQQIKATTLKEISRPLTTRSEPRSVTNTSNRAIGPKLMTLTVNRGPWT